jgi:hypothetical protein
MAIFERLTLSFRLLPISETEKRAECLDAVARCRARADAASSPTDRLDFLEMAHHCETFAQCYGFNRTTQRFYRKPEALNILRLIRPRALLRSLRKAVVAVRYGEHLSARDFIVHVCSLRPSHHSALSTVLHVD